MAIDTNPYKAPDSGDLVSTAPLVNDLASKGTRFGTLLIDYAGYFVCCFIAGIFIGLFFGKAGVEALNGLTNLVFSTSILLGYYMFFEGIWARTPGKFILGTMVIAEDGSKPGLGRIFKRTACRFIPFEAFSFLGSTPVGWHDRLSGTRVVRVPKAI
jgi:uncharacterized RDD family membrane protein YckC